MSMVHYRERIAKLHKALGVPDDYADRYGLPLIEEADNLVQIEDDIYCRPQYLTSQAMQKWLDMKLAAEKDSVVLHVVSAFRSVDYQLKLIDAKLNKGLPLDQILMVNAAPGYSEHHSGCALDLTARDVEPLSECFENTSAFKWLNEYAHHYDFSLSYPRSSERKIIYEPWHWACLSSIAT